MIIKSAEFVGSFPREDKCPNTGKPEYAFIGRSNVGKSSLINAITGRKSLAKVSNTPGKTQTINFFDINQEWHLVDLPGYGFARISKKQRKDWESMIERYFVLRKPLQCAFVLVDLRHDLQKIDLEFINWLGERMVPFCMVFTKADKLKTENKVKRQVENINKELLKYWHSLPKQFVTSSVSRRGSDDILEYITELNENFFNSNYDY